MPIDSSVFMALAFLLTLILIRTRNGPVVMIASGHARLVVNDHQALKIRL